MATIRISKKILEQKLMVLLNDPTYVDEDGNDVRMPATEITAKVAIIKQLCNMKGYNEVEKKEIINKNITLEF